MTWAPAFGQQTLQRGGFADVGVPVDSELGTTFSHSSLGSINLPPNSPTPELGLGTFKVAIQLPIEKAGACAGVAGART